MLLPALLSGCARAQGALAPTGVPPASEGFAPIDQSDRSYLPDVEPAALEPIINYVDGLNLALTGEFLYLRSTAISSCDCLAIADRLAKLFKSASLVGGSYQLKRVDLAKDGVNQKSFAVVIDRSDIRKIDKSSRQSILWSASTIKNTFTVKRIGKEWLLSDIN
ncbi:MAG: hypothetical protein ACKOFQ_06890 [Candidatus Nanopelagicus sp.]